MGDPIAGVGTLFRRWNSSSGEWEDIAQISNITGPGSTRDTIDVTTLRSTGGYREFITGLRDAGVIKLNMNFMRDTYDIMKDDFESDTRQNYEIVLPDEDATSFEFEGLVTEMPLTIPPDDKVSIEVSIKISGEVVIGSGGSESPE